MSDNVWNIIASTLLWSRRERVRADETCVETLWWPSSSRKELTLNCFFVGPAALYMLEWSMKGFNHRNQLVGGARISLHWKGMRMRNQVLKWVWRECERSWTFLLKCWESENKENSFNWACTMIMEWPLSLGTQKG